MTEEAGRRLAAAVEPAVAVLQGGGLVAYPTETVYGLGADARSERGVAALRAWKGRAESHPLTILVADAAALPRFGIGLPDGGRRLAAAFWPGPLTLVLPGDGRFAAGVGRADGAVGVRCSSHPLAAALAARLGREGVVITSTSLNRSGAPPARSRAEARACAGSGAGAPLLLDDADLPGTSGIASTVVDVSGAAPRLIRDGGVSRAALEHVLGGVLEAA